MPQALSSLLVAVLLIGSLATPARAATEVDHTAFSDLLARHVDDHGWVDYTGLRRDREALDAYLGRLATANPAALASDPDRLAFWINAYNATTLAKALDEVDGRARGVKGVAGFFTARPQRIAGGALTLDEIETRARGFHDPRVHFALVCASTSCPRLQRFAYTGPRLNEQLNRAAREFLADSSRGLRLDQAHNQVVLSPIFKWYAGDFTGATGGVGSLLARAKAAASGSELLAFVRHYAPADADRFLDANKPSVTYAGYDWSLNSQSTHHAPHP